MHPTLKGFWDHHSEYGRQFQGKKLQDDLPATEAGIQQYLASDFIDGVGPVIAGRITDKFGEDSLNVIDQHPERLEEVEGIGSPPFRPDKGRLEGRKRDPKYNDLPQRTRGKYYLRGQDIQRIRRGYGRNIRR